MLARSALITRWNSNQVPWDPWLCIRSPHVCRRLHTFTQGLQTFAYVHPMFANVCILLAYGSKVVHHAGPGIHDCASIPGPRGIHLGNCIESRPAGDCIKLARSVLITRWNSNQVPWDPWLCIMLAHRSKVVHRVPARSSNQSRPPWSPSRELH